MRGVPFTEFVIYERKTGYDDVHMMDLQPAMLELGHPISYIYIYTYYIYTHIIYIYICVLTLNWDHLCKQELNMRSLRTIQQKMALET